MITTTFLKSSRLNRITNWEELARTSGFHLPTLARLVQVSPRHLRRYFQSRRGESPRVWMENLRLNLARDLLIQGLLVKQAAAECHYKQPSHFCRVYKNHFGHTPGATVQDHPCP